MRLDNLLTKSIFVGLVLSAGCMMGEGTSALNGSSTGGAGEFDSDNCKIEGSDIGAEGLVLGLGRVSVTFSDWVGKDDSSGEYVGFSISVSGADRVGYIVKASGELYHSEDTTWAHPNGASGSNAPGISNVDFCENDPNNPDYNDPNCNDPDGCDPYDPVNPDDPYCNDPDGCDGGSGDPTDPATDPTCNDPDGCDNDPGTGCTDPNGCGTCADSSDCALNEFCGEYGVCLPYVE